MLKISEIEPGDRTMTLRLEGRVVGDWVTELCHSCEKVLAAERALKLHLADVEFMDANGVGLLMKLRARGVAFEGCSAFVEAQLKAALAAAR